LKKDPGFHTAVVTFYEGVKVGLDTEYKQILDLYNTDDNEEDCSNKISNLDDIVVDKINALEDKVIDSHQKFTDTYSVDLQWYIHYFRDTILSVKFVISNFTLFYFRKKKL